MRDDDAPEIDQPDVDRVYGNYLVTCERLSVTPVSRERAAELVEHWSHALDNATDDGGSKREPA